MSIKSLTAALAAASVLATGSLAFAQNKTFPELEPVTMTSGEAAEVDARADKAMAIVATDTNRSERYMAEAVGVLICPDIRKGGLVLGLESGSCVMRKGGESTSYWQTGSVSFGAALGITEYSYALMFMNAEKLEAFETRDQFKLGADASVAVIERGVSAEVDTQNLKRDIVAFIFDESGAYIGASLEASSFDQIEIKN